LPPPELSQVYNEFYRFNPFFLLFFLASQLPLGPCGADRFGCWCAYHRTNDAPQVTFVRETQDGTLPTNGTVEPIWWVMPLAPRIVRA
jgi:hypothetical protein